MGEILRIIILLCLITDLSAQIITFNKNLPQFPMEVYSEISAVSVQQSTDENYIAGAVQNRYPIVIKLNKFGNPEFQKIIDVQINIGKNIFVESDDSCNYYACINRSDSLMLLKYNSSGTELWKKIFSRGLGNIFSMSKKADNSLLLSGSGNNGLRILNITLNGDILWEKSYTFNGSPRTELKICKDNSFFISAKALSRAPYIYKFSEKGDSLWAVNFQSVGAFIPAGDGLLVHAADKLSFIDKSGSLVWSRSLQGKYYSACTANDGGFVFAGDAITKVNDDGESLWTFQNPYFNLNNIISTSDGGYLLFGGTRVYKIDVNGVCKWIGLVNLSTILSGSSFEIHWNDDNIRYLDLKYTADMGKTWNYIAKNLPDSGRYSWNVPDEIIENVMLKIADSENPLISDSTVFNIGYNLTQDYTAVNQIKMWMNNAGTCSHDFISDGPGLFWPGGEDAKLSAVFTDGLVWGGIVNGQIRVNGSTYRSGLRPGKILESGKADDPDKLEYNLWRLKKDWELLPEGTERKINEYNYSNWPMELGAPFEDVNSDGNFTRDVDRPKLYGDETFWFVANDLDTAASRFCYGSDPIGIEMQCTVYGYNRTDELGDVLFKNYKLINKSGANIENMCIGYWSDADLGWGSDDFVGCDSLLNLGYVYNGDNYDENYYGENPPAAGYILLGDPPMTGFIFYIGPSGYWQDPTLGRYDGTTMMYNYLNAKFHDGSDMIDPIANKVTRFWLSGDPVSGTGWHQGTEWPRNEGPRDMRLMLTTGPYNIAENDTITITSAIVLARGTDNINSVKVLKDKVKAVRNFYYHGVLNSTEKEKQINLKYSLEQNYPNPFNPSTTINYSIPERTNVTLKIFDVLGKEVTTLINEEKAPGNYKVRFNANNLSSGIYYYQIKSNSYLSARKMVLIK